MRIAFTIPGNPAPKKNSGRVVFYGAKCRTCNRGKFPRVLPSESWERWAKEAQRSFRVWGPGVVLPLTIPLNVQATFYRGDARGVDPVNLYEGLADVLEDVGVVSNDIHLATWNGSLVLIDRKNPRTEVVLESA